MWSMRGFQVEQSSDHTRPSAAHGKKPEAGDQQKFCRPPFHFLPASCDLCGRINRAWSQMPTQLPMVTLVPPRYRRFSQVRNTHGHAPLDAHGFRGAVGHSG
ncbi:hypothetical protein PV04_00085 [Phialophora macrospora]|uniref:Uncharacterized protein n=1 Tax=Phialophora macrospora TaxID=1851006 RepID=A0A0D2GHS7_9EURO|nr:hypothetical protein PV04_00085 [Phialophora macrospora]